MALEEAPAGVVSDGNVLVLFVPAIADPTAPTVTELTAAGVVKLTYAAQGDDGFKHEVTIDEITRNRFTLRQILTEEGTVTDKLTLRAVATNDKSSDHESKLAEGTTGFIVERIGIPNETAITATTQKVDVTPIKCGIQVKDAPVRNQELTYTQRLNVTGTVQRDVAIAAGA